MVTAWSRRVKNRISYAIPLLNPSPSPRSLSHPPPRIMTTNPTTINGVLIKMLGPDSYVREDGWVEYIEVNKARSLVFLCDVRLTSC